MDETEATVLSPSGVADRTSSSLVELALLFLRLGATAFGGPAAHVALMEYEVVRRREWLTRAEFLDLLGATNLIPGPNSTEMAIHIGWHRARWRGLIVAGVCFIVPAALIVVGFAWAYARFGARPETAGFLYGVKPVITVVIVQALWSLGLTALRTVRLAVIAVLATIAVAVGVDELVVLATSGAIAALTRPRMGRATAVGLSPLLAAGLVTVGTAAKPFGLWPMFLFFAKVGAVLYGSGYVLFAFLRSDLVERWGWLTEAQLVDAIAIGQVTPGPLFTTATFIGYLLAGVPGAALATVGIFLPAFAFVALSGPLVPRLRRSPMAGAVLDGVSAASLALMAVVSWHVARAALIGPFAWFLLVLSALLLLRYRANTTWLVLGGGLTGVVLAAIGWVPRSG